MLLQATGVVWDGVGLLIMGTAGVGKTSLLVDLLAAGGTLVGDDGVRVEIKDGHAFMAPVETTCGRVEMRGVGILSGLPVAVRQKIDAVVLLQSLKPERFPKQRQYKIAENVSVPLFCLQVPDFSLTSKVKMIIKVVKEQVDLITLDRSEK